MYDTAPFDDDRYTRNHELTKSGTSCHDPQSCEPGLRELSKALIPLRSFEIDARSYFRDKNDSAIRTEAGSVTAANFGASYQKALSKLWNNADKDYWIQKSRKQLDIHRFSFLNITFRIYPLNIHSNQDEFSGLMFQSMKALCQLGHLGSPEMVLLYGFRDINDVLSANV